MWPIIDKRIKSRRTRISGKYRIHDKRKKERRFLRNWIELYLNDDEPDIS